MPEPMPESAAWDFELHAQFEYEAVMEAEREDRERAEHPPINPEDAVHGHDCSCDICTTPF